MSVVLAPCWLCSWWLGAAPAPRQSGRRVARARRTQPRPPTPSCPPLLPRVVRVAQPVRVVGQSLGMALGGVQETFLPQSGVVCDYDGMRTAVGALTGVSLSIGKGVDAARFAGVRASYAERGIFLTDLSAIGDEAFTLSTPAPGLVVTTLIARKGEVLVTLSAQATLEQEVALVRMLFGG